MAQRNLYRFELSFDGVEQGVGILQGLDDTPISSSARDQFYDMFESMPAPVLSTEDDSAVICWFTKKGLIQFAGAINGIISELSAFNWQVIGKSIFVDDSCALYSDEYQVAFSRTDILELTFFDNTSYKEVASIEPACNDLIVYCQVNPSLDEKIKLAQSIQSSAEFQRHDITIER